MTMTEIADTLDALAHEIGYNPEGEREQSRRVLRALAEIFYAAPTIEAAASIMLTARTRDVDLHDAAIRMADLIGE